MSEKTKKAYCFSLITYQLSESTREISSRVEVKLDPVAGTDLWQPKIEVANNQNGFNFNLTLPRGAYSELREKLAKFEMGGVWDLAKSIRAFLGLLEKEPSKPKEEKEEEHVEY